MKTLIIGSGRLARHFQFYFQEKNIPFISWNRSQDLKILQDLVPLSTHILLAISDSALESFIRENLVGASQPIVHFSGALNIVGAASAHPLFSFGPDLYAPEAYEKIHFAITGASQLNRLIPGISNPFTIVAPKDKALYHALCVMGGNFPILLWQKMNEGLKDLGLPAEASKIYLQTLVENFNRLGRKALTGPLVRKDFSTIETNLRALSGDPFQKVYAAFVEAYK